LTTRREKSEKLPLEVTIVVLIAVVAVLVYFLRAFFILENLGVFEKGIPIPVFQGYALTKAGVQLVIGSYYLVVSIAALVIAIGLLRMRRWSWVAFMAWAGFNMIVGLLRYFYSDSNHNYLYLFLSVVVAFILNQAEVQHVFGIRREEVKDFEDAD